MSEENIERIEKKVDLLYRILLELYIDEVGHPYSNFMDELVPLFELSGIEVDIDISFIQKETMQELKNKLEAELSRLEKIYESGNFLAKKKSTIMNKRWDISKCLRAWDGWHNEYGVVKSIYGAKEYIINESKSVYEESLFQDLRKKLGVSYSYRSPYLSFPTINALIKKIKNLNIKKKNLKERIEKIRDLGEANK